MKSVEDRDHDDICAMLDEMDDLRHEVVFTDWDAGEIHYSCGRIEKIVDFEYGVQNEVKENAVHAA
jgi:hypothetical protein